MYFVLTSSDVTHQGSICSTACGWHDWMNVNNQFIKYSIVPDMTTCSACGVANNAPNDPNADQMVNVMGHELAETVTDPLVTAWWSDDNGGEIGDLCAWNFGDVFGLPNGAVANVQIGNRYYKMQQLFHLDNSGGASGSWRLNGHCALSADGPSVCTHCGGSFSFHPLTNLASCMDLTGDNATDLTRMEEYTCNLSPAQSFSVVSAGNGLINLVHRESGKCVDIYGAQTANGTRVEIYECNGTVAQQFQMTSNSDDSVTFFNPNSGRCLDVSGANPADGTPLQLWDCIGNVAQRWKTTVQ
jgi:hypothetical protein